MSQDQEWFGDRAHPTLPQTPEDHYKTPTLTVGELIEKLKEFPEDAPVGVGMTCIAGFLQGIRRLVQDPYGVVILDQTQEQLYAEEQRLS